MSQCPSSVCLRLGAQLDSAKGNTLLFAFESWRLMFESCLQDISTEGNRTVSNAKPIAKTNYSRLFNYPQFMTAEQHLDSKIHPPLLFPPTLPKECILPKFFPFQLLHQLPTPLKLRFDSSSYLLNPPHRFHPAITKQ